MLAKEYDRPPLIYEKHLKYQDGDIDYIVEGTVKCKTSFWQVFKDKRGEFKKST